MHYFLGLEVCFGHIFLGQESTMITNWKKLHASEGELVDPTLYRQLIGSLMYLVNTRPNLCFAVNTLSQFMVEPRSVLGLLILPCPIWSYV